MGLWCRPLRTTSDCLKLPHNYLRRLTCFSDLCLPLPSFFCQFFSFSLPPPPTLPRSDSTTCFPVLPCTFPDSMSPDQDVHFYSLNLCHTYGALDPVLSGHQNTNWNFFPPVVCQMPCCSLRGSLCACQHVLFNLFRANLWVPVMSLIVTVHGSKGSQSSPRQQRPRSLTITYMNLIGKGL